MNDPQVIRILQAGVQSGLGYAERAEVVELLKTDMSAAWKWRKTTRFLWDEKVLDGPSVESFMRWYSSQSSATTSIPTQPEPSTRPARAAATAAAPGLATETFGQGLTRTRVKAKDDHLDREIDGILHVAAGRAKVCRGGCVSRAVAEDFQKGT